MIVKWVIDACCDLGLRPCAEAVGCPKIHRQAVLLWHRAHALDLPLSVVSLALVGTLNNSYRGGHEIVFIELQAYSPLALEVSQSVSRVLRS